MRKLSFLFAVLLGIFSNAQVGIGTANPHPSAILDIHSSDQGLSFPKVNLQSRTDITTIANPMRGLLVFNTNAALGGGKGYYYWSGSRWEFIFTDLNDYVLENLTKYYSSSNSANINISSYNTNTYTKGASLTAEWTVISDLTQSIVIDRPTNETIFTLTGMMQANNTTTGGNVLAVIGFFVDDKLVDVKPIEMKYGQNCAYRAFNVYGTTKNMTTGGHTVKFAVKNTSTSISGRTITYGKNNSSCSNLNSDEAKMSAVTLINQPFNF